MKTFQRAMKANQAALASESATVTDEMDAAVMDMDMIQEWRAGSGWSSEGNWDIRAAMLPSGSDAQIDALANMYAEFRDAFMADDDNWIKAGERVMRRHRDDELEARAE